MAEPKAYTFTQVSIYDQDAAGRWHHEVEDAGDDVGVHIRYVEQGREAAPSDSFHLCAPPAVLRTVAAAIIRIADEQEADND